MARMHVYFVRHGETDLNRKHLHQSPSTPLNELGFDQARTIGEFLRPCTPTLLLASSYTRAVETARVIGQMLGLRVHEESLFREVERPTSLSHRSLYSPWAIWFLLRAALMRRRVDWHYEDAENFHDIETRIERAYAYIEARAESHASIVIVSHSVFISLLTLYMCGNKSYSFLDLLKILFRIRDLKNTGVTHLEYVGPTPKGTCPWLLHSEK